MKPCKVNHWVKVMQQEPVTPGEALGREAG
jgi:hypothetical protein